MSSSESAGVIPKTNWNNASSAARSTGLTLFDENGTSTTATVTWHADGIWSLPITDAPGNVRMMAGYLDNGLQGTTTAVVAGLPSNANGYSVYVYADGDNKANVRSGLYRISGTGITTASVTLTDAANTNFSGSFTQANNSNGNYVLFTIPGGVSGFTISAIPSTSSDGTQRAPLNGIQIVPR